MLLGFRMRSIQLVPRPVSPSAEGHFVRRQRRAVGAFDEPIRMLLKYVRIGLGYKWSHPDSRLESAPANLLEHAQHVAAEGLPGFQPISHRWLISIVNLDILQARDIFCDLVQIVENLLRGNTRSEAIPGTPARGWSGKHTTRRMVPIDARRNCCRRAG